MTTSRATFSSGRACLSLTASIVLTLAIGAPSASGSTMAPPAVVAWRADSLTITVPTSANLGSGHAGDTISASLGTVTVLDTRPGNPPWTATVSATNFTSGAQTISNSNISYWSGSVTAQSGVGTRIPGQPTAADKVPLSSAQIAFSGRKANIGTQSTSWQPTIVVSIPASATPGTYSGTITHSVA